MSTATKTFRGRTLEEVLPQIKADFGPDAEIVRQREGLTGGVGGFFQRACVEVEVRPPLELAQPFGSRRQLRKLVRQGLACRIPVAATPPVGGRSLAFIGPAGSGKTLCSARLAIAYATGSDLPVVCVALSPADGGDELRALV